MHTLSIEVSTAAQNNLRHIDEKGTSNTRLPRDWSLQTSSLHQKPLPCFQQLSVTRLKTWRVRRHLYRHITTFKCEVSVGTIVTQRKERPS